MVTQCGLINENKLGKVIKIIALSNRAHLHTFPTPAGPITKNKGLGNIFAVL